MITKFKNILDLFLIPDLSNIVLDYDERFNFDLQEYKVNIKKCTTEKRWIANEIYNFMRECDRNFMSKADYISSFYEIETVEAFWINDSLYVPRHYRYISYLTNEIFIGKN